MTGGRELDVVSRNIKRSSWGGIVLGGLTILACELPVILAALGFAGLSAGALALQPPPLVEKAAITIAVFGVTILIGFVLKNLFVHGKKIK